MDLIKIKAEAILSAERALATKKICELIMDFKDPVPVETIPGDFNVKEKNIKVYISSIEATQVKYDSFKIKLELIEANNEEKAVAG